MKRLCLMYILLLFLSSLLFITVVQPGVLADDDPQLFIVISDHDEITTLETNEVFEGQRYDIMAGVVGEDDFEYGVLVTVPWDDPYVINANPPWITITIPPYEQYSQFTLIAQKNGYISVEEVFTVLKGSLIVTATPSTVNQGDVFVVTVTDDDNQPVSDVTVYIQNYSSETSSTTDGQGRALLTAPEVSESQQYILIAQKQGYAADAQASITIIDVSSTSLFDDMTAMAPVFIAIIILIGAMVAVHVRKRASQPSFNRIKLRRKGIFHNKYIEEYPYQRSTDSIGQREPVIEEIRLRKTGVVSKEGSVSSPVKKEPTQNGKPDQWFHGTDDIRFKIDRITGPVDEKGKDKWCDGKGDIEERIDKALSKQSKKKQEKNT